MLISFFEVDTQIGKHPYYMILMNRNQFPITDLNTYKCNGRFPEGVSRKRMYCQVQGRYSEQFPEYLDHYGNQNRKTISRMSRKMFIDHCHNFESAWIPIIALWQNWSMLWPRSIISVALISIVSVDQQHCWALVSDGAGLEYWSVLISIDHRSALIRVNQIDQHCWEWISVGLRQGSAGEAKLPKLSRVSFACKQASDIIWKIRFHKDKKASV